jgi:hypothetical protein
VGGGCTAKKLPPYPTQAASSSPYSQVKDGLAIGIKPLTDSQESEKYFDTDLLSRGVLAIFVSAENQTAPGTFLLLKERFTLQTNQRVEHRVSNLEEGKFPFHDAAQTVVNATGMAMRVLGIITLQAAYGDPGAPFDVVARYIGAHEEGVKRKMRIQELQTKTISIGEETHGFIYFPQPPGYPGAEQWALHLEVQDINSKEVRIFDFILNGK